MEDDFDKMEIRLKELMAKSERNDVPIEEISSIVKEGRELAEKCMKRLKQIQEDSNNS